MAQGISTDPEELCGLDLVPFRFPKSLLDEVFFDFFQKIRVQARSVEPQDIGSIEPRLPQAPIFG